jgi:hypothetical protein
MAPGLHNLDQRIPLRKILLLLLLLPAAASGVSVHINTLQVQASRLVQSLSNACS